MNFGDVLTRTGVIRDDQLAELRRWKVPGLPEAGGPPVTDLAPLEEIRDGLEEVLQSKELVEVRVTDPDLIQQYLATQRQAILHAVAGTQEADFNINFGLHTNGSVILPWSSPALEEAIRRGDAWLAIDGQEVHFADATTYFYGEKKAFIVCTPSPIT